MRTRAVWLVGISAVAIGCREANRSTPGASPSHATAMSSDSGSALETLMDDGSTVETVQNGDGTSTTREVDVTTGLQILQIVASPATSSRTVTEYDSSGNPATSQTDVVDSAQVASASAAHTSALPFAQDELALRRPPRPNQAGCDYLHSQDCGSRGKCCDAHDVGIGFPTDNPPCKGSCGNLVYATLHPNECLRGASNAGCANAHGTVINCFLSSPGPGPSACCARNDCGKPQCGLDPGPPPVVLTRPDECAEIVPL